MKTNAVTSYTVPLNPFPNYEIFCKKKCCKKYKKGKGKRCKKCPGKFALA